MEPGLTLLMALTALSPLCNERISAGRLHAYLARYYAANTLDDSIDCEQSTLQLLTQDSVPGLDSMWRKAAGSLLEWKERLSKKNKEAGLVEQVDELSEFHASYNSTSPILWVMMSWIFVSVIRILTTPFYLERILGL